MLSTQWNWDGLMWMGVIILIIISALVYTWIKEEMVTSPVCDTYTDEHGNYVHVEKCDHDICIMRHMKRIDSGECHHDDMLFCYARRINNK